MTNHNDAYMNQLMNSIGPNFNISGQHDGNMNTGNYPGSHPALFGENQFKDGFGPVYAVPSFPWSPIPSSSTGNTPLPQGHGQGRGSSQQPHHQGHGMQGMQWQQSGNCPQAMTGYYMYPCYMCPSFGYQHYR